ncbi:hypothetical protein C0Q70_12680 [Pomacea canaliculata]|uniref:Ig-like domain-containing protein n=1 Tax=Pomacea canaliculata TaxID=400727 RepID=A0A2T7P281_POMCA|nr:hypothetical protein C0Q70_12680 [Pomacea canaliculata]
MLHTVEPGDVTTTCPHWVVRGGDLSCTCQTTNTASPPATVRWEGRDSEKLVKTNVQREDNGTQFTCHVTWAGRVYTSINYTLMVAGSGNVSTATDSILSSAPTLIGPIVGAVVAVVVTAIISIVLVIIIRRRRSNLKREAPEKTAKIQTCKDSEFEDHINEVYDSSETAGPHSSCGDNYRSRGQGTDREASHRNKQEVSAQYEDSPSGGYYSEIREVYVHVLFAILFSVLRKCDPENILLRTAEPGDVTTTCPHWVVRGGDLSCTCQTTNTASPPATVRWEGRDSEKLVKTNVQREDNGTQFTCHVTWAGRVYTSINYTLLVICTSHVEGPSDVVISETHHPGNNGSSVVTLRCNTTGAVYPGVNFTWSPGVCQNETHVARSSTCTFTLDAKDDGKSVKCTAINSIDSRISVSTSVTLWINGAGNISVISTSGSQSSASAVVGPIVGAVVAVVVTAVIAVLLVILIRRRRQKIKKTSNKLTKNTPCKESEFEDHINEVYDSSETAGPHSSCGDNYRSRGQGTDREASHRNQQEVSAQYEDSPSGGYYSEIREVGTGNTYPQPHHRLSMNPYSN